MKKLCTLVLVFLLIASLLTGCRMPEPGTTGATNNNPSTSTSTVRPEPTVTGPEGSNTVPGGSSSGAARRIMPN